MPKVLVTGGLGYLGNVLCPYLVKLGYDVTILDNCLYGQTWRIPKTKFIKGDITSQKDMDKATKGKDFVVALAAIVGDEACRENEQETILVNQEATNILINACNKNDVEKVVFASSCSVYGDSGKNVVNEKSTVRPLSLYARTRVASEKKLLASTLNVAILRFGTLYGWSKRMRFDLVLNIMTAMAVKRGKIVVNGGKQNRPLLHVLQASQVIERMFDSTERGIYNVHTGNTTVLEIAQTIKKYVPKAKITVKKTVTDKRDYKVSVMKLIDFNFGNENNPLYIGIRENSVKEIVDNLKSVNLAHRKYYNVRMLAKRNNFSQSRRRQNHA